MVNRIQNLKIRKINRYISNNYIRISKRNKQSKKYKSKKNKKGGMHRGKQFGFRKRSRDESDAVYEDELPRSF